MQDLTKKFLVILIIFAFSNTALGVSEVTLNNVERPNGAILFIVDGFGSSYYYPELTPHALDGSEISKSVSEN